MANAATLTGNLIRSGADAMRYVFNVDSQRARKSRFLVNFSHSLKVTLTVIAAAVCLAGVGVWVLSPVAGSLVIGLGIVLSLPLVWYGYDIQRMKPEIKPGEDILLEYALSPQIVGRLKKVDTPQALWQGIRGSWQQRLFCLRYNIPAEVFDQLEDQSEKTLKVLDDALALSKKHQLNFISTPALLTALIKTFPHHLEILGAQGIDLEELETSIDWLHHGERVVERLGQVKHFGGLARDWTSGYTPTLNASAHNMTIDVEHGGLMRRDLGAHAATIKEMVQFLSEGRQNALLVGDVGVGKTITAYGFAQKIMIDDKVPEPIKYNQIFLLNPSTIISMSPNADHVEATILKIIAEAQKSKNTILFFDDASSFFQAGTGSIDLSHVLMPVIENNAVPMIFAMTPSKWQAISAQNQALAGMLKYLTVPEAEHADTLRVLEDQSLLIEAQYGVYVTYQALLQSIELGGRYIADIAYPGKAISALENAVNHAENGIITARSVQQAIEVTQGVKVQVATGPEKEELLNLEDDIHKRMINQKRAVRVVADALRRARSGVKDPKRPIGTFLFLGPTGVGKTELSKAIADVYFGEETNMVRVDMNEYTQSLDTGRLLDATNPNSLLAEVGRNRFTVVLFDEIEKAHPEVVNVFLQMLDEGIMRDANNKEVSFRDAIIIATSNAGADSIRAYIDAGKAVEQFEEEFVSSLIDGNIFKPEFLNRFDETVIFRPLHQEELVQIVDLLMNEVNENLNKQKVSVQLTVPAKKWLAEQGYDPRLGARPLRRMVQRTVENVVAKKILQSDFTPGSTIKLEKSDLEAEAQS